MNTLPRTVKAYIFLDSIKTETILFHLLLFIIPFTVQWFIFYMHSDIRHQLPHLNQTHDNLIGASLPQRSLDEILNAPVPTMAEFDQMFEAYGNYYNVPPSQLRHLALCETRFRPWVSNGQHGGLYQYNPRTWSATRERMGLDPNPDLRFDAQEAIKTTAYKISREGSGAWVVCSNKYYGRS